LAGHEGPGFSYDNEGPRHRVFVQSFQLASRLVTNAEFLAFMRTGAIRVRALAFSGVEHSERKGLEGRIIGKSGTEKWHTMTLAGMAELVPEEPVCHVSLFGSRRLCTMVHCPIGYRGGMGDCSSGLPIEGNFVESEIFHVAPLASPAPRVTRARCLVMFGSGTRSSYSPYPGYSAVPGALGEYNGKIHVQPYVLRGGSCATSQSHIRHTYRNFFPPDAPMAVHGNQLAGSCMNDAILLPRCLVVPLV